MNHSVDAPRPPYAMSRLLPNAVWTSAVVIDAARLDERELQKRTFEAYVDIDRQVRESPARHVVRMWNFIPRLLGGAVRDGNRYMAFNAGRYAGLCEWFGGRGRLADRAPAASGVGTASEDLSIFAMSLPHPGRAIQNPLQTPPVKYSARFGPMPPCFARAVSVVGRLLVSGTAAITGEDSVHEGDLARQLDVTLANLRALVESGLKGAFDRRDALTLFRSLRVYHPRASDRSYLSAACDAAFPNAGPVEYVNVDLCRGELLVEIEGVATESNDHG